MNKIQDKNIEIKRAPEEPPRFKFEKFNHQDKYIEFAGVSEKKLLWKKSKIKKLKLNYKRKMKTNKK